MLINRSQAKLHLLFAVPAVGLVCVGAGWYASEAVAAGRWLGGGSAPGLVCGLLAGGVIVFEMLLWPRKLLRRLRLIPTKYWMAAHLWWGLASLPLAIIHSGFHWGGPLPATFMVLFVLAILTGVYGLVIQNILPRWMLRHLPAETIYNQIDYVSQQTVEDARGLVLAACGPPPSERGRVDLEHEQIESDADTVVVGAVRKAGRTGGRTLQTRRVVAAREDNPALWNAFNEVRPFLLHGHEAASPVADPQRAAQWFARLRSACSDSAGEVIDALEGFCDQRRQFDVQRTVHRWLHAWIPVHIGISVAVTVLLVAHVWTALLYW